MTVGKDGKCAFRDVSASIFMILGPFAVGVFALVALFTVGNPVFDEVY